MAKRCPMCRAPMKEEIVFHRKITLDNKPQLYHYVRRYTCPEGCTAVLDFTKAKPLVPGVRPMVLGRVEKLEKEPDFNDKLLAAGMGVSLLLFLVGIALIPTTIPIKLAAAAEAVDQIVVPADDLTDLTDKLPVLRQLDDAVVARVGYPEVAPILLIKEVLRPVEAEKLIRPVEHIGFGRRYQPGAGVAPVRSLDVEPKLSCGRALDRQRERKGDHAHRDKR